MKFQNFFMGLGAFAVLSVPFLAGCAADTASEASAQSQQDINIEAASKAGQSCGGRTGKTCATGLFCDYANDSCGANDATGTCTTDPSICSDLYVGVCGCDGNTYANTCYANRDGMNVAHNGACVDATAGQACGGFDGVQCASGTFCDFTNDSCGASHATGACTAPTNVCPQIVNPVCGCDGKTYTNTCFAARVSVSVAHAGKC